MQTAARIGQGHGHVTSHAMSCSYSLSFCVPPPLQKGYVKQQQSSSPKLYSFSGGMLDQSAWTTMGWIGWAMAWGKGLPDGAVVLFGGSCGAVLWASAVSGAVLRASAVLRAA